jgi:hypothetical protein
MRSGTITTSLMDPSILRDFDVDLIPSSWTLPRRSGSRRPSHCSRYRAPTASKDHEARMSNHHPIRCQTNP